MAKYLLVSFKTCPWVQRAAIVLREKKVGFEFRHIEPDNRPGWFIAISPHRKVPVLRIDESISLFESNAIAEYLDETVAPRLHPDDPFERAVNRAWTDYVPTFAATVTGRRTPTRRPTTTARWPKSRCLSSAWSGRWKGREAGRSSTVLGTHSSTPPTHRSCSAISFSIG
jgi:glutathione S-transferase